MYDLEAKKVCRRQLFPFNGSAFELQSCGEDVAQRGRHVILRFSLCVSLAGFFQGISLTRSWLAEQIAGGLEMRGVSGRPREIRQQVFEPKAIYHLIFILLQHASPMQDARFTP